MSMLVQVFGQRHLYEHASARFWSGLLNEHDSESIWSEALI